MNCRNRTTITATVLALCLGSAAQLLQAATPVYLITPESPDLIGELGQTTTVYEDTISDLARNFDQG